MIGKLLNILVLVVLVLGVAFAYAPYGAVTNLTKALENEDKNAVSADVDFDAVRASLREDFAKKIGLQTGVGEKSMGASIASTIIGNFLSEIASPESMIAVFRDKARRDRIGLGNDVGDIVSRSAWQGSDKFVVFNGDGEPTMLFERRGLLSWELTGVRIN